MDDNKQKGRVAEPPKLVVTNIDKGDEKYRVEVDQDIVSKIHNAFSKEPIAFFLPGEDGIDDSFTMDKLHEKLPNGGSCKVRFGAMEKEKDKKDKVVPGITPHADVTLQTGVNNMEAIAPHLISYLLFVQGNPQPKQPTVKTENAAIQRLKARLNLYGVAQLGVEGDGNCQFSAIAAQLARVFHPKMCNAVAVREAVVSWLRSNKTFVGEEGDQVDLEAKLADENWGAYCTRMATDKVWGDHITLFAAAQVFKVSIFLISSCIGDVYASYISPLNSQPTHYLNISHLQELHYDSLSPITGAIMSSESKIDALTKAVSEIKVSLEISDSMSISTVNKERWNNIMSKLQLKMDELDFEHAFVGILPGSFNDSHEKIKRLLSITVQLLGYNWSPESEPAQTPVCVKYFEHIFGFYLDAVAFVDVSTQRDLLTTAGSALPITLRGTTDIVVCLCPCSVFLAPRIIATIELKKVLAPADSYQALSQLIAASIASSLPCISVLTDLVGNWIFFWIEKDTIFSLRLPTPQGLCYLGIYLSKFKPSSSWVREHVLYRLAAHLVRRARILQCSKLTLNTKGDEMYDIANLDDLLDVLPNDDCNEILAYQIMSQLSYAH